MLKERCIAAVIETQFLNETDVDEDMEMTLACETPQGLLHKVPTVNKKWIMDKTMSGELVSGETELTLPVQTAIGVQGQLVMQGPPGLSNRPGWLTLPPNNPNTNQEDGTNRRQRRMVTGTKSVLVVNVMAKRDNPSGGGVINAPTDFTNQEYSEQVFGGNGADGVHLVSQYQACSFNQLNFVKAVRSGIVNGVTSVSVDDNVKDGNVLNAAILAVNEKFGTSYINLADHIMFCLPPGSMTGIAFAGVGREYSVYSNEWCNSPSAQLHEIGHNLRLLHSKEGGNEYGDQTGMVRFCI